MSATQYEPEEVVAQYVAEARKCLTCRFAHCAPFNTYNVLECRRYAPKPEVSRTKVTWPTVDGHNWCGEWEAKRGE